MQEKKIITYGHLIFLMWMLLLSNKYGFMYTMENIVLISFILGVEIFFYIS